MVGTQVVEVKPADIERIFSAIGLLKAELSNLGERFDELKVASTDEHRKVHDIVVATSEAMRNVVRSVDQLEQRVGEIVRRIDKIEPLTDDYREKRAEQRGQDKASTRLYWLWVSIGGIVAVILSKLWDYVFPVRPHP